MLRALSRNLGMVAEPVDADVVHCHTWYTHLGGLLAKLAYGMPLVVTTHSLEPLRPWKREQLGGGYDLSAWVERTALEMADAVIAVSRGHARRRPAPVRRRRRSASTSSTTASTRLCTSRADVDAPASGTASTHPAVRAVRRADHAAEGDRPPRARDPSTSTRGSQVVLCAGAAGHAGDRRRDGGRRRGGARRRGRTSSGSRRC